MCTRYALDITQTELKELIDIAPNSKGEKCVFPMQWQFTARDNKRSLFNARLETANEKPTFKEAWHSHRCIIPASYYFEWNHFKSPDGKVKTEDNTRT